MRFALVVLALVSAVGRCEAPDDQPEDRAGIAIATACGDGGWTATFTVTRTTLGQPWYPGDMYEEPAELPDTEPYVVTLTRTVPDSEHYLPGILFSRYLGRRPFTEWTSATAQAPDC